MRSFLCYISVCLLLSSIVGCHKEFLESKPNKSFFIPETLDELDAILDHVTQMNHTYPSSGYVASDEFFVPDDFFNSLYEFDQSTYLWDKDRLKGMLTNSDWERPYSVIFYANVVNEVLEDNTMEGSQVEINRLKGSALFYRAFAYQHLSRYFCLPFVGSDPENTPGLLLKTEADVNEQVSTTTLQETYDFILNDLIQAAELLPETSLYHTRPNRIAAWALLARIYLEMGAYEKAGAYADKVMTIQGNLLDYRELDPTLGNPFPVSTIDDNVEVLFYAGGATTNFVLSSLTGVDTVLYESYEPGDLRKLAFYTEHKDNPTIKTLTGHYTGYRFPFYGLATNEIILIRAECAARMGNQQQALDDLNALLSKRYDDSYENLNIDDSEALLQRIILERRKELIGRGLRWYDMRRLYNDDRFNVEPVRNINGKVHKLTIDQQPFVFPIPLNETSVP